MKRMAMGILLCCLTLSTVAQSSLDLFSLTGRHGFPAQYRNAPELKGTEGGLMVNLKLPIRFNDKYIWYNELTYSNFQVSADSTFSSDVYHPLDLHGFILQTGLVARISDKAAIQVLFAPRFMTDFAGSSNKNWQFGIIALYENRYKETLMLRFGTILHQDMFGLNITPIVHTDWQLGDKWSIVGMWPVFGKVNYHISENTTTGLSHFGLTTTYRLGGTAYEGDYIERNSIDLALFLRQRIIGNIHLEGRAGYSLNRNYAQFAEGDKLGLKILIFNINDNRQVIQENIGNGFIASLRVVYNLPLD